MITYRNKSLKVKSIRGDNPISGDETRVHKIYYCDDKIPAHRVAFRIKKFIETGDYRRIVEIKIFGGEKFSTEITAIIIYEEKKEKAS